MTSSGPRLVPRHRWASAACMAWILLVSGTGCNTSPFTIVPVSGTVLLDGQPLAGGVINFQPIVTGSATNSGPGSTARIDPEGHYSLSTMAGQQGAVVGKHRVKIYSFSAESDKASTGQSAPRREQVPARYNYRSDVTFDVPAQGTDKADFSIATK